VKRVRFARAALFTFALSFLFVLFQPALFAQAPTGTLTGTALDPSGAAIVGADIKVVDNATRAEYTTVSGADGQFRVGNLNPGVYTVTVTMKGFRKGVFTDVKIIVSEIYDLTAKLELGDLASTVVVEAGQEVVQTESATVGASIVGRSITELPFTSRSTLDLATLMPGAATTGRTRQTSFNGLPKGSINITYDGINAQDNLLKSNDGFFTITRPSIDAVEEFTISTAASGAEEAAQGAVQIKMETKRGGNAYHGGVWEYFRNDYLNANYFFNNEAGVPRQKQRLNQYGFKIGGPILKDKLFFFGDMDNYSNPQSRAFTREILTQDAANGIFTYGITVNAQNVFPGNNPNAWTTCVNSSPRNNGGPACTVNLAQFAANNSLTYVTDPAIGAILSNVEAARGSSSISTNTQFAPWLDNAAFNQPGTSTRHFPDVRFDWNATKTHQLTVIYHYSHFNSSPDFLNNFNPFMPVAPFNKLLGSQISNRNQYTAAWRWNVGTTKSNELRFGFQTALVAFFPDENAGLYPVAQTNLGKISIRPVLSGSLFPNVAAANFQPILSFNAQGRNTPLGTLLDNFSWSKGKHNLNFGGDVTEVRFHQFLKGGRLVQTANIGLASVDPASASGVFNTGNFPETNVVNPNGSTTTNTAVLNAGGALYGVLTGRLGTDAQGRGFAGTISVDPSKRQFVPGAPNLQQGKQHEFGFYATDSWRTRPTLTLTFGLRWDYQGAPYDTLNESFSLANGYGGIFGLGGVAGLFQPFSQLGSIPQFQLNNGGAWYNTDMRDFSPNVGLAWQPNVGIRGLRRVFAGNGKTVFRAGYSISYTREGFSNFNSIAFGNPGIDGSIFANPLGGGSATSCPAGPYTSPAFSGNYPGGCVTLTDLENGKLQALTTNPASFPATGTFPVLAFSGQSVNAFDPHLRTPRVQSWSAGIQRQLGQDTVLEVRYVANHATGLWRQDNLNEVNIFENGFLSEFNNAAHNLAICRANSAACKAAQAAAGIPLNSQTSNNFADWGLAGQAPLPIMTAAFTGSIGGSQTNANFRSGTFVPFLGNGVAGAFANTLATTSTFMCNLAGKSAFPGAACPSSAPAAGPFPANFFMLNPHATGGAFRLYNGSQSTYNALQMEVRRRLSKGLQVSANYTFSKSLTNYYGDSSVNFVPFTTLRSQKNDKGPSPWDLRNAFKADGIYEFPFGPGHKWSTSNGFANRIIGGWEVSSIHRWQSGRVFLLQSGLGGTFNQNDPGVVLNGITRNQLQDMLGPQKTPNGQLFYFPSSLIAGNGTANPAFIAPCTTPGKLCSRVFLTGPRFYRADFSLIKKTTITERLNFEMRAEALNAFNNINFFFPGNEATSVPAVNISSQSFARITDAFRDPNTTDDNGGRILQLVMRFNF